MSETPASIQLLSCDEMLSLGIPVGDMLEALEDDLGAEAVWKLTQAYGGVFLHIPQPNFQPRSVAVERLGEAIVSWLYCRLGHGRTQIPMGPCSQSARNLAAFRAAFLNKKSRQQIAREMNCHLRTVERMAGRLRDAGFL